MNEEKLKHIFEPFYTSKEEGKSYGLGLSAVYGAVQQLEGSISIQSKEDHGTVVSVMLPVEYMRK